MPADRKVSVGWQVVFTFIPVANFWAFYRIRRLRKYLLYIIVPEIIISVAIGAYDPSPLRTETADPRPVIPDDIFEILSDDLVIASYAISIALHGLTIYLIIIWSRQHNRQYDQPTVQPN